MNAKKGVDVLESLKCSYVSWQMIEMFVLAPCLSILVWQKCKRQNILTSVEEYLRNIPQQRKWEKSEITFFVLNVMQI